MKVRKKFGKLTIEYLAVFSSWKVSSLNSNTVIKCLNYKNECRDLFGLFQEVLAECLVHKIMMLDSLLARCTLFLRLHLFQQSTCRVCVIYDMYEGILNYLPLNNLGQVFGTQLSSVRFFSDPTLHFMC